MQTWSALPTCAEMARRHGRRAGPASAKASAPGPSRSAARPRSSAAAAGTLVKPEPVHPKHRTVKRESGTRRGIAPVPAESDDVLDLTGTSGDEADEVLAPAARRRSAPARAAAARRTSTFARAADAASGKAAAAAAAPAGAEEDEKDEVMFTEEKSLDEVLAVSLPAAWCAMRSLLHASCQWCIHWLLNVPCRGTGCVLKGSNPLMLEADVPAHLACRAAGLKPFLLSRLLCMLCWAC